MSDKDLKDLIEKCSEAKESEVYFAYRDAILAAFSDLKSTIAERDADLALRDRMIADRVAKISALEKDLEMAREAMQEFVDKVDRGEARSVRSYAKFKDRLSKLRP